MKVISFSLWGNDPLYVEGLKENLLLAPDVYPGWQPIVYLPGGHQQAEKFRELGAKVVVGPGVYQGIFPMFWRFLACANQKFECVIIRDADSRLSAREAHAVDDWLESGRGFHVMRDHADHNHWPVLGGMWGATKGACPDIGKLVLAWGIWRAKLDDMKFLAQKLWPRMRNDMLQHYGPASLASVHVSGNWFASKPFLSETDGGLHVGEIVEIGNPTQCSSNNGKGLR